MFCRVSVTVSKMFDRVRLFLKCLAVCLIVSEIFGGEVERGFAVGR